MTVDFAAPQWAQALPYALQAASIVQLARGLAKENLAALIILVQELRPMMLKHFPDLQIPQLDIGVA